VRQRQNISTWPNIGLLKRFRFTVNGHAGHSHWSGLAEPHPGGVWCLRTVVVGLVAHTRHKNSCTTPLDSPEESSACS